MPAMPWPLFIAAAISPATNVPWPCDVRDRAADERAREEHVRREVGVRDVDARVDDRDLDRRKQRRLGPEVERAVALQVPLLRRERVVRRERDAAVCASRATRPSARRRRASRRGCSCRRRRARACASRSRLTLPVRAAGAARRAAATLPDRRRPRTARHRRLPQRQAQRRPRPRTRPRASLQRDLRRHADSPAVPGHDARAVGAARTPTARSEAPRARRQHLRDRRPPPSPFSCWICTAVPGITGPHDALELREVRARLQRDARRDDDLRRRRARRSRS